MKWVAFILETKSDDQSLLGDGAYLVYGGPSKGKLYNQRTALVPSSLNTSFRYYYLLCYNNRYYQILALVST